MQSSLSAASIAALAGVMIMGALIPGVSVLAVSARSAAFGLAHGISTSLGILVGDILFILIAIYGLSMLAGLMGGHFVLIKIIGGAYLVYLGLRLWKSRSTCMTVEERGEASLLASFMTGLLITLGDQKAILFYLGFLPAFVDLSRTSPADTGIILGTAAVAVGGPKLFYAFMAHRAGRLLESARATRTLNVIAGSLMAAVGVFLIARAL
ncbi:MAG: LysE family translocator [Thiogranum sp.]|nr:LysE family translocator [Thiogranum sp.]